MRAIYQRPRHSTGTVLNLNVPVTPAVVPVRETVGYQPREIQVCHKQLRPQYIPAPVVIKEIDARNDKANVRSWSEAYLDKRPMMGNLVISAFQGRGPVRPPMAR